MQSPEEFWNKMKEELHVQTFWGNSLSEIREIIPAYGKKLAKFWGNYILHAGGIQISPPHA